MGGLSGPAGDGRGGGGRGARRFRSGSRGAAGGGGRGGSADGGGGDGYTVGVADLCARGVTVTVSTASCPSLLSQGGRGGWKW